VHSVGQLHTIKQCTVRTLRQFITLLKSSISDVTRTDKWRKFQMPPLTCNRQKEKLCNQPAEAMADIHATAANIRSGTWLHHRDRRERNVRILAGLWTEVGTDLSFGKESVVCDGYSYLTIERKFYRADIEVRCERLGIKRLVNRKRIHNSVQDRAWLTRHYNCIKGLYSHSPIHQIITFRKAGESRIFPKS
jgi:hypothetical protein